MRMMRLTLQLVVIALLFAACGAEHNSVSVQNFPEGNFSAFMPSPIQKVEKTEETVFGKQARHFVKWQPSTFSIDKFKLFEISYITCPPSVSADSVRLNQVLDSAVEMRKKDFSEVDEIGSQAIELNGYPGRAFFYDAPKGNTIVTVKICVAGGRLYDLVVVAKKNYSTNAEASNFFNSFKLLQ